MSIAAGAAAGYLQRSLRREIPLFCARMLDRLSVYIVYFYRNNQE